jgi:hypothetical protein
MKSPLIWRFIFNSIFSVSPPLTLIDQLPNNMPIWRTPKTLEHTNNFTINV